MMTQYVTILKRIAATFYDFSVSALKKKKKEDYIYKLLKPLYSNNFTILKNVNNLLLYSTKIKFQTSFKKNKIF